jgi:ComF family protein
LWEGVLDVALPRRARRIRAEVLQAQDIPLSPTAHTLLGSEVTTLMNYDDSRDLIQSLKYDRSFKTAHILATLLGDYLREEISAHRAFSQKPVLLIPIPLHRARKAQRGYNQIGVVLDALPDEFKNGTLSRIAGPVLERIKSTPQQTKLPRAERLSNLAGAFEVIDPEIVDGTLVYLVDDVATTGATLVNAATPLRRAGADVVLVALSRA